MTRDPLDDLGQGDLGLMALFGHLTSEPSADELAGEYAALTMFRTAFGDAPLPARRHRRLSRARLGGRLVAAGTVVALGGGFAAAGYAAVLPAPLQHAVHQIFGFAGVPNSPGKTGSARPTAPVVSHRTTQGTGGSSSPQPAGTTSATPRGGSPSPHRSPSASPSSAVIPAITVSEVPGAHGRSEVLVVSIPLAQRGDVVQLEDFAGGRWRLVRSHRLHQGGTEFSVVPRKISVTYRVVLPATAKHGRSVSGQVTVAARPKKGGHGGH